MSEKYNNLKKKVWICTFEQCKIYLLNILKTKCNGEREMVKLDQSGNGSSIWTLFYDLDWSESWLLWMDIVMLGLIEVGWWKCLWQSGIQGSLYGGMCSINESNVGL